MDWADSTYIVIMYYRAFSCGKFLSNVLGFNRNFVPMLELSPRYYRYCNDIEVILADSEFTKSTIDFLEEYKLRYAFLTIPSNRKECVDWHIYEYSEHGFWNIDFFTPGQIDLNTITPVAKHLLENQQYCFVTANTVDEYHLFKKMFKNAKTIQLINDEVPNKLSREFKGSTIQQTPANLLPLGDSFKFDIGSIFDKDIFFKNISALITDFKVENKTLNPQVYRFYDQYINLYKL